MVTKKYEEEQPAPKTGIDWSDPGTVLVSGWRIYKHYFFIFLAIIMVWSLIKRSYVVVPVGNKAVIMEFGKVRGVVPDGLHFTKPWVTTVRIISIRVNKAALKAEAVSKDTQKVMTEAVINWTFKPDKLQETYETVGAEEAMVDSIMLPALNESLKAVTAKYQVADILNKREEIKEEIDVKFRQKMQAYHVNIIDLFLTNLRFEDDYEKAIEAKQVAEVNVKTAQNDANSARMKAQGDADSAYIRAQGEAKSKRVLSSTLSQANLQLEWIKAWEKGGSQVPQFITSGNAGSFMMDMSKLKGNAVRAATPAEKKEETPE